jgi:phage shock protein A
MSSRVMTVIRANLNDRISRAEDPARLLDQVIIDMRSQLELAKRQVCVAIADERVLRRHVDDHAREAAQWEKRAMMAVRAGDDNLARAALARKSAADDLAAQYETQWAEQKRSVDALRQALRGLDARIGDAMRQRTMLIARLARANAQRTIAATLSNLEGMSPYSTLERMEQRVVQMEAEVEAVAELDPRHDMSLDAQFAALASASTVDDELAALKRRYALECERERKALPA